MKPAKHPPAPRGRRLCGEAGPVGFFQPAPPLPMGPDRPTINFAGFANEPNLKEVLVFFKKLKLFSHLVFRTGGIARQDRTAGFF